MSYIMKRKRLTAMWGAFIVSTFIAVDIATVFGGVIYIFLEGVLMYTAIALLSGVILLLFIRFYRHAYKIELELQLIKPETELLQP